MTKARHLHHMILQNTSLILIIASLLIAIISLVSCSKDEEEKSGHTRGSTVDLTLKDEPFPDTYFNFPIATSIINK